MSLWTDFRDLAKIVGSAVVSYYTGNWAYFAAAVSDVYGRDQRRKMQRRARDAFLAGLKDRYQMVRGGIEPRKLLYGEARISGPIVFAMSTGAKKEFLHIVVALVGHQCDSFRSVLFNDVALPAEDGSGFIQSGEFALTTSVMTSEPLSGTSKVLGHVPASILLVTRDYGLEGGSIVLSTPADYTLSGSTLTIPGGESGYVNYTYNVITPKVRIKKFLGTGAQAASADLVSECTPKWTANHQLRDICYVYIRLEYDQQVFGQVGLPNISAILRGKLVYDPRTTATVWSENAALCTADYLRDLRYGLGASAAEVPGAEVTTAADISDQIVPIYTTGTVAVTNGSPTVTGTGTSWLSRVRPGMTFTGPNAAVMTVLSVASDISLTLTANYAGSTLSGQAYSIGERRYTANGVLDTADPIRNNLDKLAEAMAGAVVWVQGRWLVRAGAHLAPAMTITEDFLSEEAPAINPRAPRQELFNRVTATYSEREKLYTDVQAPPVINSTYTADDGGLELPTEVTYDLCSGGVRAQRLAKIHLEVARQALTVSFGTNLKAYDLQPTDVVALTLARYGWSSKLFVVVKRSFDPKTCKLKYVLRETASGVWDWALGAETAVDLTPNTTLPSPFATPPVLTGMSVTSGTAQLLRLGDGTIITQGKVSWAQSTDAFTVSGGRIEIRWKLDSATDWTTSASVPGDSTSAIIGPLDDLRVLLVQIRPVNARGRYGGWTTAPHLVTGKTAAPANVASLTATTIAQGVSLTWAANVEVDHAETELKFGASWAAGTRIFKGNTTVFQWINPPVGAYTIWAKHFDTSGNESATAATVAATVLYQGDVNATFGAALNGNPQCSVIGPGGWSTFSGANVLLQTGISGGVSGTTSLRSESSGVNHTFDATKQIPYDRDKAYRFSVLLRRSAAAFNGGVYLGLLQFDSAGAAQPTWGTYLTVSLPAGQLTGSFERYTFTIPPNHSGMNAGCMFFAPDVVLGYNPGSLTGYAEMQDCRLEELPLDAVSFVQATKNMSIFGRSLIKLATGVGGGWSDSVYSNDSYVGGAYCAAYANDGQHNIIFGLNTDPTTDNSYTSIDYAWYINATGNTLYAVIAGVVGSSLGTYTTTDKLTITYDGLRVRWFKNGTLLHSIAAPSNLRLYFDSSFNEVGARINFVEFGPLTAINPGSLPEQGQGGALNSDPGCSDINAWSIAGTVAVASITDGAGGVTCLRFSSGGAEASSKLVSVSAGKTFRASAWLRKPSGTGTQYLRIYFWNGAGALLAYGIGVEGVTLTGTWVRYQGTQVAPAGAVTAQAVLIANYSVGTGTTEAQDVRLEEVINTDLLVGEAATSTVFVSAAAPTLTGLTSSATFGGSIGLLCQATWLNNTPGTVLVECTIDNGGSRTSAAGGAFLFSIAGTSAGATGGTNNGDLLLATNSTDVTTAPGRRVSSYLVSVPAGSTCYAEAFGVVANGHTPAAALLGNAISCRIAAIKR